MEIVVITGMSGAGKSAAVDVFEDLGFNCVDNMPPVLISKFIEVCSSSNAKFERLAIVVDMRTGVLFDSILDELTKFRESGVNIKILFLEASDDALIKRYKETRRRHSRFFDRRRRTGTDKACICSCNFRLCYRHIFFKNKEPA